MSALASAAASSLPVVTATIVAPFARAALMSWIVSPTTMT